MRPSSYKEKLMDIKTFEGEYEVEKLNYYTDCYKDKKTKVLDIVIKCDNVDFITKELNDLFIVHANGKSYIFPDYKLIACYKIGDDLIRAICVK